MVKVDLINIYYIYPFNESCFPLFSFYTSTYITKNTHLPLGSMDVQKIKKKKGGGWEVHEVLQIQS
jgi:hypothetical protein